MTQRSSQCIYIRLCYIHISVRHILHVYKIQASQPMTVLITGAAGRTSRYVVRALLKNEPQMDLRLLVRSEAAAEKVQAEFPQLPHSAFAIGDYLESSTLPAAFQGVDVVFHNGPAFHSQETAMGIAAIDAAREAGVKHFVFCSVLFPLLHKLLNHEVKLRIEEYLIESDLDYTILEPTSFMQNINLQNVITKSVLPCGYSPKVLQGFLDLQDLADIARLVIVAPLSHNRARYELVGENCSLEDVAKTITRRTHLVKNVVCQQIPRDQVVAMDVTPVNVQGVYAQDALDRMLYYYNKRGIPGNNNTVRWLLGREPTTWKALVDRELGK